MNYMGYSRVINKYMIVRTKCANLYRPPCLYVYIHTYRCSDRFVFFFERVTHWYKSRCFPRAILRSEKARVLLSLSFFLSFSLSLSVCNLSLSFFLSPYFVEVAYIYPARPTTTVYKPVNTDNPTTMFRFLVRTSVRPYAYDGIGRVRCK